MSLTENEHREKFWRRKFFTSTIRYFFCSSHSLLVPFCVTFLIWTAIFNLRKLIFNKKYQTVTNQWKPEVSDQGHQMKWWIEIFFALLPCFLHKRSFSHADTALCKLPSIAIPGNRNRKIDSRREKETSLCVRVCVSVIIVIYLPKMYHHACLHVNCILLPILCSKLSPLSLKHGIYHPLQTRY